MNETVLWRAIWTGGIIAAGTAFTRLDLGRERA